MRNVNFDKLENAGFTVHPLRKENVQACIHLEQKAFNELRIAWHQSQQQPRREDWLLYQAEYLPENVLVLEKDGTTEGWIIVHQWGTLGWMGPVVINPEMQGYGLGRTLTEWSLQRMQALSCTTIGLETWAFNYANLGLYLKCGFDMGPLIGVLEKPVSERKSSSTCFRVNSLERLQESKAGIAALGGTILPGLDYSFLAGTLLACRMGEVLLWGDVEEPQAMAVIRNQPYTTPLSQEFTNVEVLAIQPEYRNRIGLYLEEIQAAAVDAGKKAVRISVTSADPAGFRLMVEEFGFRLLKTRLRMYAEEGRISPGAVNYLSFSV
ncbi:MAG: GNAT family N-acetyltransferase [Anaerolineales bacterium]|nr:GNAT family N-acetyltransferase [Anaerolineales bacterium]